MGAIGFDWLIKVGMAWRYEHYRKRFNKIIAADDYALALAA